MSAIIGFLGGCLVTWLVAHHYYRRGGDELRQEAERLRHLSTLILRALEDSGLAKLAKDESGEITGLRFELHAEPGAYAITGADAHLTVKHRDDAS